MRNALIVGINDYGDERHNLNCCINDAEELSKLLEFNEDGSRNFGIIKLLNTNATYDNIVDNLKAVFKDNAEIALFYFSGHGYDDEKDGKICTSDFRNQHMGLRFRDIIDIVQDSKCKNKIVILDCCHSGKMGNFSMIGDTTLLECGTTILTACNVGESSIEVGNHGVFTKLLIDALQGGASDIFGRVTPGAIYSYIDSSLGNFDQRPLFKSHVESFVTIRLNKPKITHTEMRNLMHLFEKDSSLFQLNPSYEPTNYPGSNGIGIDDLKEPYFDAGNGKKFALLQKATSNGLVKPSKEKYMFYAAMNSDTCQLTPLGKHYWWLVNNKIV